MTMLSDEQLNNCSKEDLVNIIKTMQNNYLILEERIAAINANTYGRKTEKLLPVNPDQMNIFNELECVKDETEYEDGLTEEPNDEANAEPETEEITYTRRKKGKRELDLEGLPRVIENHEIPEEELIAKFGKNGWKRLPDQVYSKLEVEPAKYYVVEHHIAVYSGTSSYFLKKSLSTWKIKTLIF